MSDIWAERFDGRFDARVTDRGKAGWWLTVTDSLTGHEVGKCRASQPYSTMGICDAAEWYRRDTENIVHQYVRWAPIPALAAAASGGDVKQAPGEAPQSGLKGNAQGDSE